MEFLLIEGFFSLQKLHFRLDACAGIQVALVALGIGLKTPLIEVEESSAEDVVVAARRGQHMFESQSHCVDGVVPQIVGVGV